MKSILGMGNALTDILALLPDTSLLEKFHLPYGSMQHVDAATADTIWRDLKPLGVQYVAGGSAANTITGTAVLGMPSGFVGKWETMNWALCSLQTSRGTVSNHAC